MREQHVGPAHGLRPLAVRVARKNRVDAVCRFCDERATERGDGGVELIDGVQRPQPQIGGNLIVARAAGVQLARDGADFVVQQALHERVDVFIGCTDRRAIGQFFGDAIEAVQQL